VVPAASAQAGDSYSLFVLADIPGPGNVFFTVSRVAVQQTISGGGPVTVALPDRFIYAGPVPAAHPTFDLNYTGFPGSTPPEMFALISWTTSVNLVPLVVDIDVESTPSYQNGAPTITIPNLSGVPGFFSPAPSGQGVNWQAGFFLQGTQVFTGGTYQEP